MHEICGPTVEPAKRQSLAIVGSAPLKEDFSEFIDNCDCVVRFNNCKNYGGHSGVKTDLLILNSAGDRNVSVSLLDLLQPRTAAEIAADLPFVTNAQQIWFIRPPAQALQHFYLTETDPQNRIVQSELKNLEKFGNMADELVRHLGIPRYKVRKVTAAEYRDLWRALRRYGPTRAVTPSTGTVGIHLLLADPKFRSFEKHILGFTWEGWDGHPWALEYAYIRKLVLAGELRVIDGNSIADRYRSWVKLALLHFQNITSR